MITTEIKKNTGVVGVTVLSLAGELLDDDISVVVEVFKKILKGNSLFVVCDLTELKKISASSIGHLLNFRRNLLENNGNLVLANLHLDVLEFINSLEDKLLFKVYSDVKSAIDFFRWEYEGEADEIALNFPSDLAVIPPIRQFAKRIAEEKGYSKKDSFRIETIVDEVCNNAVEHGGNKKNDIILRILIDREKIEISVTNTSLSENRDSIKKMAKYLNQPNTALGDSRGRGLALVRMLSNDVVIENIGDGTSVRVTKVREE